MKNPSWFEEAPADPPECNQCGEFLEDDGNCITCNPDPTPWCHICGAHTEANCGCGPIAENH